MSTISSTGIGSGLDIDSLVSKLVAAERAAGQTRIDNKKTRLTEQFSAMATLMGAMSGFQASLNSLVSAGGFDSRKVSVSDEAAFTDTLLATLDPRQIAAAFVRLYRKGRSAPEELRDVDLSQRRPARERRPGEAGEQAPRAPRDAFGPGRWISISVGRKQNAEPRWLIPMLCRAGGITRNEIGAIRMQQEETYVEIAEASADAFLARIGPKQLIE